MRPTWTWLAAVAVLVSWMPGLMRGITSTGLLPPGYGTEAQGGTVSGGSYSGVGTTCDEAKRQLDAAMGLSDPTCDGCPDGMTGCHPSSFVDPGCGSVQNGCTYIISMSVYVTTAVMPESGCAWVQRCSACLTTP